MFNTIWCSWTLRLVAATIMLQTLYFKFTGHADSIAIFSQLGVEPWGRYGSGIVELLASVLLLLPTTKVLGAVLAIGTMLGAIAAHLFVLGIATNGDGGLLFGLAMVVLLCSIGVVGLHTHYFDLLKKYIIKIN